MYTAGAKNVCSIPFYAMHVHVTKYIFNSDIRYYNISSRFLYGYLPNTAAV